MTKVSLKLSNAQQKKARTILKNAGLLKPHSVRGPVTDYTRRQIRKYLDVVKGHAEVVKTPSRQIAKSFERAPETGNGPRVLSKGNLVIVPKKPGTGRSKYNKKLGVIRRAQKSKNGDQYRFSISPTGTHKSLPRLLPNQSYAIPSGSRYEPTYIFFADENEFWATFGPGKSGASYKDVIDYVEIMDYIPNKRGPGYGQRLA